MKKIILCALVMAFAAAAGALDSSPEQIFAKAIELSNQGNRTEAIRLLESIEPNYAADARFYRSLGLLYKSNDQIPQAISTLEKAQSLAPSIQIAYALALLYEAQLTTQPKDEWRTKAIAAWRSIQTAPDASAAQKDKAKRHLERLQS